MNQIKHYKSLIFLLLITALGIFLFHQPVAKKSQVSAHETEILPDVPVPTEQTDKKNDELLQALVDRKPAEGKSIRVPILMYHHVGEAIDTAGTDLTVSAADFESEVKYFSDQGYHTVSLEQVYNSLINGTALPDKPIVFTFDDGYKDVFVNAIPILQKYGYTGSFAIATELLGRNTYAVWDDVINASKLGMEIVSHTENHLDLTNPIYSDDDLNREIFGAKKVLEDHLGTPVDFFVYPYGKHNEKVEKLVADAGYKLALSTAFGMYVNDQPLLTTPRFQVHGGAESFEKLKRVFEIKQHTETAQTNL